MSKTLIAPTFNMQVDGCLGKQSSNPRSHSYQGSEMSQQVYQARAHMPLPISLSPSLEETHSQH